MLIYATLRKPNTTLVCALLSLHLNMLTEQLAESECTTGRRSRRSCAVAFQQQPCVDKSARVRTGRIACVVLAVGCVITVVLSVCSGAYPLSIRDILQLFTPMEGADTPVETVRTLIVDVRMPRIMAALFMGAGLSAAGASYQGIFRNSLVSPDILGASSGAGFGAALGLLIGAHFLVIQTLAFCFGIIAVLLTCVLGRAVGGSHSSLRLVLTGMVTGSIFVAGISIIKTVADPADTLPSITFWLMGSLAGVKWADVWVLLPPVCIGGGLMYALRWKLNAMSLSDEEARTMGVDVARVRMLTLVGATLISSVVVAVGGLVGWVGLLVPHMARFIVGPNNRELLPVSMLMGACYLVIADDLARLLFRTEFPLSVVTCACGAPVFLILLRRSGRGWAQ